MPPATTLPGPNGMWAHPYGGELGPIAYDHDKSPAEQQEQRNDWYAEQRESGISVSDLFLVLGRSAADGILMANSSRWWLGFFPEGHLLPISAQVPTPRESCRRPQQMT